MQLLMTPEKSTAGPAASSKAGMTDTPSAVDTVDYIEEQASNANPSPANNKALPNSPPEAMPQRSKATGKTVTAAKPAPPLKPSADQSSTPPPPAEHQPSLPVSMIVRPDSAGAAGSSSPFPGELEESFESALARVERARGRKSVMARILGSICELIPSGAGRSRESVHLERTVAFDGFRNDLFEEKRERDRRYGTVYTVSEEVNAFLVRLELPRRMAKSSLKQAWDLPDEMPDYTCMLTLADNVLSIRAGLPDEARRRLSYVSSSFPSDFQTRIEFQTPVEAYKHRLQNKVLEIIVYKQPGVGPAGKSRRQQFHD